MPVGLGIFHRGPHLRGRLEPCLQPFHLPDLFLILFDPFFYNITNHWAGRISVSGMAEYLFDLGEREAEFLGR